MSNNVPLFFVPDSGSSFSRTAVASAGKRAGVLNRARAAAW